MARVISNGYGQLHTLPCTPEEWNEMLNVCSVSLIRGDERYICHWVEQYRKRGLDQSGAARFLRSVVDALLGRYHTLTLPEVWRLATNQSQDIGWDQCQEIRINWLQSLKVPTSETPQVVLAGT